jgi:hypothetical protein
MHGEALVVHLDERKARGTIKGIHRTGVHEFEYNDSDFDILKVPRSLAVHRSSP